MTIGTGHGLIEYQNEEGPICFKKKRQERIPKEGGTWCVDSEKTVTAFLFVTRRGTHKIWGWGEDAEGAPAARKREEISTILKRREKVPISSNRVYG